MSVNHPNTAFNEITSTIVQIMQEDVKLYSEALKHINKDLKIYRLITRRVDELNANISLAKQL